MVKNLQKFPLKVLTNCEKRSIIMASGKKCYKMVCCGTTFLQKKGGKHSMLSGEYKHSLDAKNRVSVPADMREELGENFFILPSVRGKCLRMYSAKAWQEYIEPLKALPREVKEQLDWFFYHDSMTTTPDSLGRVRIKDGLLRYAQIDPEATETTRGVTIVGRGDYAEIWSADLYADFTRSVDMDMIRRIMRENNL